jgi:Peptidase C13 family
VTLRRLRLVFPATALLWAVAIAAGLLLNGLAAAQDTRNDTRGQAHEQAHKQTGAEVESAFQRQPELLERALAGLKATQPGQPPQLFFVSFAGWGPEAVFMREALAVRDLFDERFGTRERSLVLINHASTHQDIALASPPNLEAALRRVGTLMRKDKDVLFLFLTSHGKKDLFAVEVPGLPLDDLTPASLKAILDGSGIRNRVVVLSACHSGSFIPALADPSTLVIAAAHADRTSFGCEDKRQWTYFGDAYFNRALRRERSFERAFHQARRTIGRWEASERLVRSLPQIAGGEALAPQLEALARMPGIARERGESGVGNRE